MQGIAVADEASALLLLRDAAHVVSRLRVALEAVSSACVFTIHTYSTELS